MLFLEWPKIFNDVIALLDYWTLQNLGCAIFVICFANRSRSSAKKICEKHGPSFGALTSSHIAILFPLHLSFIRPQGTPCTKWKCRQRLLLNGKRESNLPPLNRREVELWKPLLYNSELAQWSWDKSLHWWTLFSQNSIPSDGVLSPNQF